MPGYSRKSARDTIKGGWSWLLFLCLTLLAAGCGPGTEKTDTKPAVIGAPWKSKTAARAAVIRIIDAGDSIYAYGKGYSNFSTSLRFFDSAMVLAQRIGDSAAIAEAVFAKGRVYDALNQEPEKTIAYYAQAAGIYERQPGLDEMGFYLQFLVAHAYGKSKDTAGTLAQLRKIKRILTGKPDSILKRTPYTVELALTATRIGAYALADSILDNLTKPGWIYNTNLTIAYKDHYYLTRARIDVYGNHLRRSPYLDSLAGIRQSLKSPSDRRYHSYEMAYLLAAAADTGSAFRYLDRSVRISDSLTAGPDNALKDSLAASELRSESRLRTLETARLRSRNLLLGLTLGGMAVILVLLFYLTRQYRQLRRQSTTLATANQALDHRFNEIELLNKEIQHRVKNNLYMLYSLLQMQLRRSSNPDVVASLNEARLRVKSISTLNSLLQDNPKAGLSFSAYLTEVVQEAAHCLSHAQEVRLDVQAADVSLTESKRLAVALIINEWITNSIKYAVPPPGVQLEVSLEVRVADREVAIRYRDNGLTSDGIQPTAGLGLQIVDLLVRQLNGVLRHSGGHPFRYDLAFPL